MATLNSRIEEASKVITTKNATQQNISNYLTEVLNKIGIDDSEIGVKVLESDTTTFEMFEQEFLKGSIDFDNGLALTVNACQIPVARLKFAWEVLKGKSSKKESKETTLNDLKPIGQWDDLTLLERFSRDCPIAVEEELAKRAKGRFVIIFNDDESVDVENSLYMLRKARVQETPATFFVREDLKQVFRVGEYPLEVFYECPIHPQTLLVDGYCDECSKKWSIEEYDRNVLLRLVVDSDEVSDIRPYKNMAFNELAKEFPKVFIQYKELKTEGKLPSLKRKLSRSKSGDPFRVVSANHRTY